MAIKKVIEKPVVKEPTKEFKLFLEKGYIFEKEVTSKWYIDFGKFHDFYQDYANWFNWKFNNPCICKQIFMRYTR